MTLDPAWVVSLTLLASFVLLFSDKLRYDIVALLVVITLVLTGALEANEAFAGFSSEAVIVVGCMCVFGHAMSRWGVAEGLCQRLFKNPNTSEAGMVARLSFVAAIFAAFMTDTAVVGVLIPIAHALSRQRKISISRLLLPISFGCFLGDLLLVVGSAKNIALNGAVAGLGGRPFSMFEFTHFGACVLVLGVAYLAGPGRKLLPRSAVPESLSEQYQIPKFVTEVVVEEGSDLIGRMTSELRWARDYNVPLLGVVRGEAEKTELVPSPYTRLEKGDLLIVQGEPENVLRLQRDLRLQLGQRANVGDTMLRSDDVQLVEAVVPASSHLIGRTLAESDFRARTGLHVLAISKHGKVVVQKIGRTALDVGDTLLIQGHRPDVERARREREILVLGEHEQLRIGPKAWVTVGLLLAVLLLAGFGVMTLGIAALAGAVGLVLTGCVPAREVYEAVDWVVLILIGGMLALGKAFDKHELGAALANWVTSIDALASHPHLVVVGLCLLAVILAQAATSVGTAVLLAPVALSLAAQLHVSERAFLMAVLCGTNCAFLSPVANAANAMVVGPGGYRFRDFLRAGLPLTILIVVMAGVLIPIFWPL
ncbi:MAG: SLC13 family permease [Planctomycetes bacterium]|nr:SLC13 family permease [Planctomycetota bacterium]